MSASEIHDVFLIFYGGACAMLGRWAGEWFLRAKLKETKTP